jgi:hypothetical protein
MCKRAFAPTVQLIINNRIDMLHCEETQPVLQMTDCDTQRSLQLFVSPLTLSVFL